MWMTHELNKFNFLNIKRVPVPKSQFFKRLHFGGPTLEVPRWSHLISFWPSDNFLNWDQINVMIPNYRTDLTLKPFNQWSSMKTNSGITLVLLLVYSLIIRYLLVLIVLSIFSISCQTNTPILLFFHTNAIIVLLIHAKVEFFIVLFQNILVIVALLFLDRVWGGLRSPLQREAVKWPPWSSQT